VKTYRGDVRALDTLSLVAETGTVFGLLRPNGAGKSTTVKILTTLSRPDAGEARVAGYNVVREPAKVRFALGRVAQKSGLDPGGIAGLAALAVCAALLGTAIGARSKVIALLSRREEAMIAVSNFVLVPMTFLSLVFMAQALMPQWMQSVAKYNPVGWAVRAGRVPGPRRPHEIDDERQDDRRAGARRRCACRRVPTGMPSGQGP